MEIATLTSKGQVTIPADIREHMHVKQGDKLMFIPLENGNVTIVPKNVRIADLAGILKYNGPPVTLEDIQRGIEEGAVERFLRSKE
jgi:antitoxin PrlF